MMYDTYKYVYCNEAIVFRIIVDPNTGERAVNQLYPHSELAVDDPVAFTDCPKAMCSSGGWSFPGKDQVQSVETVFEPGASNYVTIVYTSFGLKFSLLADSNKITYRYTAREKERYGILYFRKRYYNSVSGMFLSVDSVRRSFNKYIYAANHPTKLIDPFGMKEKENKCECKYKFSVDESCNKVCNTVLNAIRKACEEGVKRAPQNYKNAAKCISEQCRKGFGYWILRNKYDVKCSSKGENGCNNKTCAVYSDAFSDINLCPKFFKFNECEQGNIFYHEMAHTCGYTDTTTYDIANASFPECPVYPGDCEKNDNNVVNVISYV